MGVLLYYQISASKFVAVLLIVTIMALLCVVGVMAMVKLYTSRVRAMEAEKHVARLEAAEKTRRRIASDLHSSIGQSIAASKALVADLLQQTTSQHPGWTETLRELHDQLTNGLVDLRQLSQAIQGARLLETGMLRAMQIDIELARRLSGCVVKDSLPTEELPLPNEVKMALYRIFQDALSNIYRHARATLIEVSLLHMAPAGITLVVADNGVGFDSKREHHHVSLGLESIRQHAAQLGGSATIASTPGSGTIVTIQLPKIPNCYE